MKELIQRALGFAKALRKFFETEPLDEQTNIESGAYSQYNSPIDDTRDNFM